jgi:hypothetical protein
VVPPPVVNPLIVVRPPFTVISPLTLVDLASFRPAPSAADMEPHGWTVVGLPTNFWVDTAVQVVAGTLLDRPASVRFTPVAYQWSYGDGTSARTASGGASWATLGVGEFAVTPTSHVFRTSGVYMIQPSVVFSAEYRFDDGDWIPVEGTVTVAGTRIRASAATATTVLVTGNCTPGSTALGC